MTIVSCPFPAVLRKEEQLALLIRWNKVLPRVKSFVVNFLNHNKLSHRNLKVFSGLLRILGILEKENYYLLMNSTSLDFEIQIQGFFNKCNAVISKVWWGNMDLQSALKYYKAVLPAYFSKSETETSQVITQASWEIKTIKLNAKNAT